MDVSQGSIGNCYFMAAASALAEKIGVIKDLFHDDVKTDSPFVTIDFFIEGQRTPIIIDDYLPVWTWNNSPAFAQSTESGEIWIMLLEKAYAKMRGNYETTEGGFGAEGMALLSGCPHQVFKVEDHSTGYHSKIKPLAQANFPMTCGTKYSAGGDAYTANGICYSHAYTLLDVMTIQTNSGSSVNLFKIRNPHATNEWKGDWSDKSSKWSSVSSSTKSSIGYVDADDGVFFMQESHFKQEFELVSVCFAHEDYTHSSVRFTHQKGGHSLVEVIVEEHADELYFILSQAKDDMTSRGSSYGLSPMRLALGKEVNGKYEYQYANTQFYEEQIWHKFQNVQPGKYMAYVEVNWENQNLKDDAVFRTYGKSAPKLRVIKNEVLPQFYEQLMSDCLDNSGESWFHPYTGYGLRYKTGGCEPDFVYIMDMENTDSSKYFKVSFQVGGQGMIGSGGKSQGTWIHQWLAPGEKATFVYRRVEGSVSYSSNTDVDYSNSRPSDYVAPPSVVGIADDGLDANGNVQITTSGGVSADGINGDSIPTPSPTPSPSPAPTPAPAPADSMPTDPYDLAVKVYTEGDYETYYYGNNDMYVYTLETSTRLYVMVYQEGYSSTLTYITFPDSQNYDVVWGSDDDIRDDPEWRQEYTDWMSFITLSDGEFEVRYLEKINPSQSASSGWMHVEFETYYQY